MRRKGIGVKEVGSERWEVRGEKLEVRGEKKRNRSEGGGK